uniref:Uncharacterized protein n=1 Tax=Arabidopsis thaliana TaxID=3702 RepID=Q0WMQ9_ARATH|nr:hypothetical protein [Arabidopsis thaliana]
MSRVMATWTRLGLQTPESSPEDLHCSALRNIGDSLKEE